MLDLFVVGELFNFVDLSLLSSHTLVSHSYVELYEYIKIEWIYWIFTVLALRRVILIKELKIYTDDKLLIINFISLWQTRLLIPGNFRGYINQILEEHEEIFTKHQRAKHNRLYIAICCTYRVRCRSSLASKAGIPSLWEMDVLVESFWIFRRICVSLRNNFE